MRYRSYGSNNSDIIYKYEHTNFEIYYRVTVSDYDVFIKLVHKILEKGQILVL